MLLKLMMALSDSAGIATVAELARKLEMGEQSLLLMIDQLVQLGYLADPGRQAAGHDGCRSTCHCSGCDGCPAVGVRLSMWEVAEKGRH